MLSVKPFAVSGQKIGLLGGSFDPPHAGHVHISKMALRRFGLDRVWWLVSPGNPLKKNAPADFGKRMVACKKMTDHPRIFPSDIEARFGTQLTAETLRRLLPLYPGVRFVWLMGADNLTSFHKWQDWQWIMEALPIGVLSRPGEQVQAGLSPAARTYGRCRVSERKALGLPLCRAPAWCLLSGPTVDISSTELRIKGEWDK